MLSLVFLLSLTTLMGIWNYAIRPFISYCSAILSVLNEVFTFVIFLLLSFFLFNGVDSTKKTILGYALCGFVLVLIIVNWTLVLSQVVKNLISSRKKKSTSSTLNHVKTRPPTIHLSEKNQNLLFTSVS